MVRVLLVEDDEQTCTAYRQILEHHRRLQLVHTTGSEQDAFDYATNQEVDAMILDLALQTGDGLTLIFRLQEYYREKEKKPLIMVVTNNASQVTWAMAKEYGADYVIPKVHMDYSPLAVLSKLEKAYLYSAKGIQDMNVKKVRQPKAYIRRHIEAYLNNIGLKMTDREKLIIVESVLKAMDWKGSDFAQLSKEVYPIVARKSHVSRYSLEKYIRTALRRSWNRIDETAKQQLCPYAARDPKRKMTNTEFIVNVAKYLKG